jgi:branched-chain amino acid transport system permease protein
VNLSRLRGRGGIVAVVVAAIAIELLVVAKLIPAAGSGTRGAPSPILFLGLVHGLVSSLTAAGIVLIYRSVRVINFAQTAIGGAGFVVVYNFTALTPVPFPIALVLGLLVAAAVGLIFELIFVRRFFHAPRLVLTVFTIVAASFVGGFARNAIDSLPIFPEKAERSVAQLNGSVDLAPELPFSGFHFRIGVVDFGFVHVFAIAATLFLLAAVALFLRYTRIGVAVRALAENSERAALLGISVGFVSSVVWSISALLSGASATMSGLLGTPSGSFGFSAQLLLPALAAAVLARMSSISVAVVASIGIELFARSLSFLQPELLPIYDVALLVVIAGGLLTQRARASRSERGETATWAATDEVRRTPKELSRLTLLRVAKWVGALIVIAGVIVFPFVSSTGQVYLGSVCAIQAILALSLVVLTGWTGQVSLGQFGLAAVGGVVTSALAASVPFWLAIPAGIVVTAAVAVAIGLPALRLPGLYLAVATFAFAAAVPSVLFSERLFGWLLPDAGVTRPTLPFIDFEDERSMYFLALVCLAVALLAVRNLRNSRFGRILIGLRDNEPNAESAGISPLRLKLTAFGIAGALAGFAGALLAFQQRGVTAQAFGAEASVDLFVASVIGGIGSVFGPLVGVGVLNALRTGLSGVPELAVSVSPLLAIVILYIAPAGLISVLAQMRDAVLRIVAQRNDVIVPSLFADIDPESLHLRLVPVGAPSENSGLVRVRRRYDIDSVHTDVRDASERTEDTHALAAAVRSISSEDGS